MESKKIVNGTQGYGKHPTIYGTYSNESLYAMYRGECWFHLCESERQQLVQETVNRAAIRNGELGACKVKFEDLSVTTLGEQSGNTIKLNYAVFVEDKYIHNYNGYIIEEAVKDSNLLALETVLHEDIHAWQNQCIKGTISCQNQGLLREYTANDFTVSLVSDENGTMQLGSHYLNGLNKDVGYYLYYFQATERDAHYYSEKQTLQIMEYLQSRYGTEPSFIEYQDRVLQSGYDTVFQRAEAKFGNADFEKDMNQVLMNAYYGTNIAVEPQMQTVVQKEMAESYLEQMRYAMVYKEEIHMDKNYTPVTIEDYDRTMREAVNVYYEHAMNDPSISKEQAYYETAQMSENYLNTMEELQEAHENGEIASIYDSVSTEVGNDGIGAESGSEADGGIGADGGGVE